MASVEIDSWCYIK